MHCTRFELRLLTRPSGGSPLPSESRESERLTMASISPASRVFIPRLTSDTLPSDISRRRLEHEAETRRGWCPDTDSRRSRRRQRWTVQFAAYVRRPAEYAQRICKRSLHD